LIIVDVLSSTGAFVAPFRWRLQSKPKRQQ